MSPANGSYIKYILRTPVFELTGLGSPDFPVCLFVSFDLGPPKSNLPDGPVLRCFHLLFPKPL